MTDTHPAEQVAYTEYAVYSRITGSGMAEQSVAADLARYEERLAGLGVTLRGIYDVTEFKPESDVMVWTHAERPEALQVAGQMFRRLGLAQGLTRAWSAVGVHVQAEFTKAHAPAFMYGKEPKKWVTVYPFVRSHEWYLLPEDERAEMLREHGLAGRKFPNVLANTVGAFALGDYEWLLSFEADELLELVDMMRDLRYTKARLHVREELPFYTGRRVNADELTRLLG
ncbi:hydrogen peroxide-dependent heme synthase [Propionibacteriaceae bacterium Y1923]|uniref:hydrogen peroxide-dependent heme synthase n=1 Tax=Aestuariimicrobium sp. Y1814 TaxID=3418742 RepID=UPI003C29374C